MNMLAWCADLYAFGNNPPFLVYSNLVLFISNPWDFTSLLYEQIMEGNKEYWTQIDNQTLIRIPRKKKIASPVEKDGLKCIHTLHVNLSTQFMVKWCLEKSSLITRKLLRWNKQDNLKHVGFLHSITQNWDSILVM